MATSSGKLGYMWGGSLSTVGQTGFVDCLPAGVLGLLGCSIGWIESIDLSMAATLFSKRRVLWEQGVAQQLNIRPRNFGRTQQPPYYLVISCYISFLIIIYLRDTRDFLGPRFYPDEYEPSPSSCLLSYWTLLCALRQATSLIQNVHPTIWLDGGWTVPVLHQGLLWLSATRGSAMRRYWKVVLLSALVSASTRITRVYSLFNSENPACALDVDCASAKDTGVTHFSGCSGDCPLRPSKPASHNLIVDKEQIQFRPADAPPRPLQSLLTSASQRRVGPQRACR
ncbi:hypothetical protein B0H11DRAFT_2432826 [Mycena galericulata]|nr:hypothetical protein B0H11DRAFT_2432826 [Mycena galericulata]